MLEECFKLDFKGRSLGKKKLKMVCFFWRVGEGKIILGLT